MHDGFPIRHVTAESDTSGVVAVVGVGGGVFFVGPRLRWSGRGGTISSDVMSDV